MSRLFFILSFLLSTISLSNSAQAESLQGYRYTLENGMVVIIHEIPSSPVISIYPLVKTGSATEGIYLGSGISHFVEHMLFKGTKKRAVNVIGQEVKALGGDINAATSFDYTIYTLDLPAGHFKDGLDIVSDMLMNSLFDPEEVEREREVILGEVRMINDRPERKLGNLVQQTVYERHPYRHPIIGYVPLFKAITQNELVDYFQKNYIPNNIIFSVAGPVKAREIFPLIEETFKDFKPGYYRSRNLPFEPGQIINRWVEDSYETQVTRFSMAYKGVALSHQDMYALDVLAKALGQGESSRLYKDLYEKKRLVESISAYNFTPVDLGYFEIEAILSEDKVKEATEAIKENIKAIQKNSIKPDELKKVKQQVVSEHIFGKQTASSVAYQAALDESSINDFKFSEKYVERIRDVSVEDIKRVAQKYFNDQNLSVVVLRPEGEKPEDLANADATNFQAEIEKVVLKNGLTLLLKEDHTFPLVSIQVASQAGVRQEPPELNGISELTSRLWLKGTQKLSAQGIATDVEEKGAQLNTFSGKNSMGLQLNILSEHTGWGLTLLDELIKTPQFDQGEFQKAKELIMTDLKLRDDQIMRVTLLDLQQTLFKHHPFRMDGLGTPESIQRISREDIAQYYKKFISPSNLIITVFGDMDQEKVLAQLEKSFEPLPSKEVVLKKFEEEPPQELQEKIRHMPKEQAAISIGFQAPALASPERYTMEVIESIFGSTLSGRLFVKVRDELGKAYALGADYVPSIDTGMVYFYVLTTDSEVERVKEIILNELKSLDQIAITDEELNSSKAYLKGNFNRSMETIGAFAFKTLLDELYGLGFNFYLSYEQKIDAVTKEELIQTAKKYLDPQKAVIAITRPQSNPSAE